MTAFVLVHGAWAGSWGWKEFSPLLRKAGHDVYTPCLTGLGERVHLGRPDTNLDTHIQDIVNTLFYEDLRDVVLVGHSYGGMAVTGAADRVPERIAHLVYLDAFLPKDGESCWDLGGGGRDKVEDGWRVLGPQAPSKVPLTPEMEARQARRTSQPIHTLDQPVRLSLPLEERPFTRTYIRATGDPNDPMQPASSVFDQFVALVRPNPAWRYLELPTGHGVHRSMPNELAELLLSLARPD